uniref:Protein hunchback n=1 Tax=Macrostomum lignano TaxID=282301 RepID=A0A1I8IVZ3_9PLAT
MFLAHGQSTRDDGNYPRQLRHDVADKRCTNQSAFVTSSASQTTASQSAQSASPDSESCQDDPDENAEHRLRPNDPKTREDFPEPERGRSCEERTFSADVELAAFSIESGSSPPKTPTATTSVSMATGSSETTKQTKQPTDAAATSASVAYFEFDEEDQLADELEEDEVVEDLDDLDDEVDEDQEAAVAKRRRPRRLQTVMLTGSSPATCATTPELLFFETYWAKIKSKRVSRETFRQHMGTHYDQQCPQCDYKCRTSGRLRRHVRDFHSVVPPPTYTGRASCPKVLRCKQCDFTAEDKTAFWEHARSHIKADRMLQCPKCPFVTEYKHHLEYHIRNHFGSKPYKCGKCNYQCVNRSMLNSHLKSHTNVYQHRCRDCGYASKYCHSLRQHLRKYGHQPAATLNPDGSMPEEQAASAAKSRRRQQKARLKLQAAAAPTERCHPVYPATKLDSDALSQQQDQVMFLQQPQQQHLLPAPWQPHQVASAPKPPLLVPQPQHPPLIPPHQQPGLPFSGGLSFPFGADQSAAVAAFSPAPMPQLPTEEASATHPLDLSAKLPATQSSPSHIKKKRLIEQFEQLQSASTQQQQVAPASCSSSASGCSTSSTPPDVEAGECRHCGMLFRDSLMYHLHMAFHSRGRNPFRCGRCGVESRDRLEFFIHLARSPHLSVGHHKPAVGQAADASGTPQALLLLRQNVADELAKRSGVHLRGKGIEISKSLLKRPNSSTANPATAPFEDWHRRSPIFAQSPPPQTVTSPLASPYTRLQPPSAQFDQSAVRAVNDFSRLEEEEELPMLATRQPLPGSTMCTWPEPASATTTSPRLPTATRPGSARKSPLIVDTIRSWLGSSSNTCRSFQLATFGPMAHPTHPQPPRCIYSQPCSRSAAGRCVFADLAQPLQIRVQNGYPTIASVRHEHLGPGQARGHGVRGLAMRQHPFNLTGAGRASGNLGNGSVPSGHVQLHRTAPDRPVKHSDSQPVPASTQRHKAHQIGAVLRIFNGSFQQRARQVRFTVAVGSSSSSLHRPGRCRKGEAAEGILPNFKATQTVTFRAEMWNNECWKF